mmetsp:Transcript_11016/g.17317  ORF Transcript_11016/g.17317 Transcript_11016/m.17317 type:complete len:150 (-) Transcript_11016:132-581(-)
MRRSGGFVSPLLHDVQWDLDREMTDPQSLKSEQKPEHQKLLAEEEPEEVDIWLESLDDDAPEGAQEGEEIEDVDDMNADNLKNIADAIIISKREDSQCLLLIPSEVEGEEWEAWDFAAWIPGQRRYSSFRELMLEIHQSNQSLPTSVNE